MVAEGYPRANTALRKEGLVSLTSRAKAQQNRKRGVTDKS